MTVRNVASTLKLAFWPFLELVGHVLLAVRLFWCSERIFNFVLKHGPSKRSEIFRSMLLSDLGNLFEKRRDFTKAIEMYRKAIETDPSHAWCYVELAELYRDLGDRELARKAYKQAMESSDFSTEFKRILEQRSTALEMNAAE